MLRKREMLKMKKKLFNFLFVVLAVIMAVSVMVIPALAGPPEEASGSWIYAPVSQTDPEFVGCNTVIFMTDEGDFTGTFVGQETETGMLVFHCNGKASYKGNLTFTGTVAGSDTGTMELRIVGKSSNPSDQSAFWQGTWVILSGTGGLETLRGRGIWMGGPGDLVYEGNYHFEPN